jgi:transcriptional regulator with XRE-family HTH domain
VTIAFVSLFSSEKMDMEKPQTWRDLLAEIIQNPEEKRRVANALGVNPLTLTRWLHGESVPRLHNLRRLLESFPDQRARFLPLIINEFSEFSLASGEFSPAPVKSIPVTFYSYVLNLSSVIPSEQRFWSICNTVLHEALGQLDPGHLGLQLSVIQCHAPSYGNTIRCLRERVALGTPPWEEQMEPRIRFLGAESLAGYVVSINRPQVIANRNEKHELPNHLPEHALSAVAVPILYASRSAGCLLVASTQPDYFSSPALLELIQEYASLLMLAFHPGDFYDSERIALQIMPSFEVQQSYFSSFRQRIITLLKKAAGDRQSMNYNEAEQQVWWQIEEELLQLP